ncbi:MAG: hypothetical protein H7Z13_05685 [Ferruginibacter sp.]|nr:hypothetical protein [Ferruginibacter sp.]
MKKTMLYSLLAVALLISCRKSDNPKIPSLTRVPVPLIVTVANSEAVIDVTRDPALFKGNFNVGLLFPQDVLPRKFDIVIIKNGNKANVKTFKTDIASFPSSLEVTGAQLIAMFGTPIILGDFFDIGADITLPDGQKLEAFPAVGTQFAGGTANIPGSGTFLRYTAICRFNIDEFVGDFKVLVDEWVDYLPGETVTLTRVDATHLSFKYPTTFDVKPIVITVNPNNSTTVTKVAFGRYSPTGTLYLAETVPSVDNVVLPCDKTISVRINITSSTGANFGNLLFKLKKA